MRSVGPTDPPEYNWLYSIPAAVFTGGFLLAAQTGFAGLVQAGYLTSSILCISTPRFIRFKLPNSFDFHQAPFLDWVPNLLQDKGMCSACWALARVSLRPWLPSGFHQPSLRNSVCWLL
jgi:hypothetical protein